MNMVASWTGGRADTLRQALRMTNEAFAEHLGVAVRTVAYWRARPDVILRPVTHQYSMSRWHGHPSRSAPTSGYCSPSASTARHRP